MSKKEIRVEIMRPDNPVWAGMSENAGTQTDDTHESAELRLCVEECERALQEVHDEVERVRSEYGRVDRVVVDVERYSRLWAMVDKGTNRYIRPPKEKVESFVGVDISVVEADNVVEAVAEDSGWVLKTFVFDDGGDGR